MTRLNPHLQGFDRLPLAHSDGAGQRFRAKAAALAIEAVPVVKRWRPFAGALASERKPVGFGVPRWRPPRLSPGFDPLGIAIFRRLYYLG